MKKLTHSILGRLGIRAFRLATLPCGADEIQDLRRLLTGPVRAIFDVGANVGRKSLRYAHAFPQAKVFAFEPFSETFSKLQAKTASEPRIEPVRCAIGATRTRHRAAMIAGASGWNSLQPALNDGLTAGSDEFPVETIDGFCVERKIDSVDLLKTDTEGYDLEVIRGAADMLANHRIRLVLSECAFDRSDRRHTNFFDLYELLHTHGYQFLGLSDTIHAVNGSRKIDFTNALFGV